MAKIKKVEFAAESPQQSLDLKVETYETGGQIRTKPFTLLFTFEDSNMKDGAELEIKLNARNAVCTHIDELVFVAGEAQWRLSMGNLKVKNGVVDFDFFDSDGLLIDTITLQTKQV